MNNPIKFIFKSITHLILHILFFILNVLVKVLREFTNKLRFSIAFKLNLVYGFLYLSFFLGTYGLTLFLYYRYIESTLLTKDQFFMSLTIILSVTVVISFILFLIIGRRLANKILKPISTMNNLIENINAHKLDVRLDISGAKDELKDLARTFNTTLDRLEIFIEKQKQFVSDASHELRTPIAVIQGYANLLDRWGKQDPKVLEESISAIKQETDSMKDLVEKLLFLARSDNETQKIDKSIIDLSSLSKEVLKETLFIDDEHEFTSDFAEHALIEGDPKLIKELFRIFVDNAIKYTPENGTIKLITQVSGNNVIWAIKDTGIGMSDEHTSHIFERFYRADEARNKQYGGTGLGLSIAKWIIDSHQGKIYVKSKPHIGSEFIIFFNHIPS